MEKKRRYKKNKTPNQSEKCGILSTRLDSKDPHQGTALSDKSLRTNTCKPQGRQEYLDVKKDYKTTFDELRKKYKDNYEDQASYQTSKRFFIDA